MGFAADQVIDEKYKLLNRLGRGGMGEVWEAERVGLRRRVAIKFLLRSLAQKEDFRTRFLNEAKVSGMIDHDNICEVIDLGVSEDEDLYYVMPLLKGEPLSSAMKREAPFPVARACDVTLQMLNGLDAAHKAGIVHRDLKPQNIFLTTVGDRPDFVKIFDYGIAKALDGTTWGEEQKSLTATGAILGTPFYMAPEQARGDKDIDGRIDLYAVGVMLYHMLTGVCPIRGESPSEVFWNIWMGEIPPARQHRPDLPEPINGVVLEAMKRERDERYPSAKAFHNALLEALPASSVELRTTWRPLETDPNQVAPRISVVNAVADDAPTVATPTGLPPTESQADGSTPFMIERQAEHVDTAEPSKRNLIVGVVIGAVALVALLVVAALVISRQDEAPTVETATAVEELSEAPEPNAAAQPEDPPIPPPPEAVAPAPAVEPQQVRITLEGLPQDASVTVDGQAVEGATFQVPRGDEAVQVAVRAEGYQPWEEEITASEDRTVTVELERLPRAGSTERRPGQDRRPGKRPQERPRVNAFGEMP